MCRDRRLYGGSCFFFERIKIDERSTSFEFWNCNLREESSLFVGTIILRVLL